MHFSDIKLPSIKKKEKKSAFDIKRQTYQVEKVFDIKCINGSLTSSTSQPSNLFSLYHDTKQQLLTSLWYIEYSKYKTIFLI